MTQQNYLFYCDLYIIRNAKVKTGWIEKKPYKKKLNERNINTLHINRLCSDKYKKI